MQVYTRYRTARRRWSWPSVLYALAALGGVAGIGWLLWHRGALLDEPGQAPAPAPRTVPGTPQSPPAARQPAPGTSGVGSHLPAQATSSAPRLAASELASTNRPAKPTAVPAQNIAVVTETPPTFPRPAGNILEAQIVLAHRGYSSGALDGATGNQTRAALRAFQRHSGLPVTGALDAATSLELKLEAPPFSSVVLTSNDFARLTPVSRTWLGKSRQRRLDFETILELVAERHRAHPELLRKLNPGVDWTNAMAGLVVTAPNVVPPVVGGRLAWVRIGLQDRVMEGFDAQTNVLFHFPCSIASRVEKRPVGRLQVVTVAVEPTYTFNPEVFPESAEARRLKTKLTIPPGPNNPVGVAWIGLSLPGYGIHGTPRPEDVGRTESHGCFRLANWDAEWLAKLVWHGLPVLVEY